MQDDIKQYDNSIHMLHTSSMITEIFQTYEGELLLAGPKKLLWHNVSINPQNIQVLPKKDRVFPFAPQTASLDNDHTDNSRYGNNLNAHALEETSNDIMKRQMKVKRVDVYHRFMKRLKKYIRQLSTSPMSTLCIGVLIGFTLTHANRKTFR